MSQHTTGSTSGIGAIEGGPLVAVAGMALIINFVGLYAFTGVALCVFGYIALTLALSSRAERTTKNSGSAGAGTAVMILSWLVALIGGALVGGFHWVQYAHAAYAVLGVYAAAVLTWLIGRAYSALWLWLFPIAGVAMLAAVMQLGSPPGADDMEKSESWTPVNVAALDEAGRPIDGATVYLDLVQFWQGDPELDGDREWWSKAATGSDGTAQMALHKDPRFKRLVVRVRCGPFARGYNEPKTFGGYVGYEDARLQTVLPVPKVPYAFQVVMKQRTHPESALLAIDVAPPDAPPDSSGDAAMRCIKLALTTERELPWYEDGHNFNDYFVIKNGRLRDVFLKGPERLVFQLGPELAARPLTLHVLEHDPSRYDESYLELAKISIDAIALAAERILPPLTLPGRTSASSPQTIGAGIGNTDRR